MGLLGRVRLARAQATTAEPFGAGDVADVGNVTDTALPRITPHGPRTAGLAIAAGHRAAPAFLGLQAIGHRTLLSSSGTLCVILSDWVAPTW